MSELSKDEIRRATRARRAALPARTREAAGRIIGRRVLEISQVREAKGILVYASTEHEVPLQDLTDHLLATGRRVLLPRLRPTGIEVAEARGPLSPGPHGILEPEGPSIETEGIEVVLVPGIAFDKGGNRLGNGGGAYDRFLATSDAHRIGIGFACQLVARIPAEPHDVRMHRIITEEGSFEVR